MGVLRAGEDAVLTPWKVLSHDAEVILPHDLEEKTTQGRRKRGGNGSFSGKCLDQRLCQLFLLKCPGLTVYKPFILYF